MPLIKSKSKQAFGSNVSAEMSAGKPQKQSLAIAYNVQKKASSHRGSTHPVTNSAPKTPAMAKGGMAMCAHGGPIHCMSGCYADGGDVPINDIQGEKDTSMGPQQTEESGPEMLAKGGMTDDERFNSIADAIIHKKKAQMLAEGGMAEADEYPELDSFEDLDEEAADKKSYDVDQVGKQPKDSNEHGDDIDSDDHDMISSIRKKMKAKRGA